MIPELAGRSPAEPPERPVVAVLACSHYSCHACAHVSPDARGDQVRQSSCGVTSKMRRLLSFRGEPIEESEPGVVETETKDDAGSPAARSAAAAPSSTRELAEGGDDAQIESAVPETATSVNTDDSFDAPARLCTSCARELADASNSVQLGDRLICQDCLESARAEVEEAAGRARREMLENPKCVGCGLPVSGNEDARQTGSDWYCSHSCFLDDDPILDAAGNVARWADPWVNLAALEYPELVLEVLRPCLLEIQLAGAELSTLQPDSALLGTPEGMRIFTETLDKAAVVVRRQIRSLTALPSFSKLPSYARASPEDIIAVHARLRGRLGEGQSDVDLVGFPVPAGRSIGTFVCVAFLGMAPGAAALLLFGESPPTPQTAVFKGVSRESAEILKTVIHGFGFVLDVRESTPTRRSISAEVRREVWRRDEGKCVDCGSRERLEYDHIIAFANGGSNTARNIELRCEVCNRRKGAKI